MKRVPRREDGSKYCSKCFEWKPLSEFGLRWVKRNGDRRQYLQSWCKECRRRLTKEWQERTLSDRQAYYKSDRRLQLTKAWRKANADKMAEYKKRYVERHPERVRAAKKTYRNEKGQHSKGKFTAEEWLALCERYGGRCLCCGNQTEHLVQDHVVPLFMGGSNTIDNLQPLCWSCNARKWMRTIDYRPETRETVKSVSGG